MNDVDLVPVGIAQIRAEIADAIVWTLTWFAFIRSAVREPGGVSDSHGRAGRGPEGDHTAVPSGRRLAVTRDVDVEAGKWRLAQYPAKRRRATVWCDAASFQPEWCEHSIVETARALKITRSDSDMAEHPALPVPTTVGASKTN